MLASNRMRRLIAFISVVFALCCPNKSITKIHEMTYQIIRVRDLSTKGAGVAIAWSPDGQILAAASDFGSKVTEWNRDGELVGQFDRIGGGPALGGSIAFLSGSSELAFLPPDGADNNAALSIWDSRTGRILRTIQGPEPSGDYPVNRMHHFAVSDDQSFLVGATSGSGSTPGVTANIGILDTKSGTIKSKVLVPSGVSSISLFNRGRFIAAGTLAHGKAMIFDSESAGLYQEIRAFDDVKYGVFSIGAIAGSPDGRYVFVGVGSLLLNGEYYGSHEQREWADASETRDSVRIYDLKTGRLNTSFVHATAPIRQSAWDPKGRFVAFLDSAAALYLVNPKDASDYQRVTLPTTSLALSFSPDGKYLAVATDRGVRIFSIN